MKKKLGLLLVIVICIIVGCGLYFFSSIGTGQGKLNDKQLESLANALAPDSEFSKEDDLKTTCQAAIKIHGIDGSGENMTVYGYVSEGEYVKYRDAAYMTSGGNYPFMVDIKVNNDNVEIVKEYGDGVASETTINEMPFRYRFISSHYDPFDAKGNCKLEAEVNQKVEKALGVPVDTEYSLSIDGDKFEIFKLDNNGLPIIIGKGTMKDFAKESR